MQVRIQWKRGQTLYRLLLLLFLLLRWMRGPLLEDLPSSAMTALYFTDMSYLKRLKNVSQNFSSHIRRTIIIIGGAKNSKFETWTGGLESFESTTPGILGSYSVAVQTNTRSTPQSSLGSAQFFSTSVGVKSHFSDETLQVIQYQRSRVPQWQLYSSPFNKSRAVDAIALFLEGGVEPNRG